MKIKLLFVTLFSISYILVIAKPKYYVRMADSEMKRNPESWQIDFAKAPKWDYCNGLELQAFYKVWEKTHNEKYLKYIISYTDKMIATDGTIKGYKPEEYNIDKVNSGKMLFSLYGLTNEQKYRSAIENLHTQMKTHPKTISGGYWHKKIYPYQMWLDGIYMASPFLAEYALRFDEPQLFDEVTHQILTMAAHSYDPVTGLYYHAWDESKQQAWANPLTGTSPNFWSRSIGWYMMAMVDVLEFLPVDHPQRKAVIKIFNDLCKSLLKFRDPISGMWYQVTDQPGKKGNYIESSGSAMFVYSIVKGSQKGFLPKTFLKTGQLLYSQFVKRFIKENPDGTISVTDCCAVAGLGGSPRYRDGSYEYYLSEPIRDNDPKTIAPFMMVSVLLDK